MPDVPRLPPGLRTLGPYALTKVLRIEDGIFHFLSQGPHGNHVVVKFLPADRSKRGHWETHPLEAETRVARHASPIIAGSVLDYAETSTGPYSVVEFIEGDTLQRFISNHGPLDRFAVRRLAMGLATLLVAAHHANIALRALDPNRILLSPDGPRLTGFTGSAILDGSLDDRARDMEFTNDLISWANLVLYAGTGLRSHDHTNASDIPIPGDFDPDLLTIIESVLQNNPGEGTTAEQLLDCLIDLPPSLEEE
ncbi:hypothetical protein [Actinomadura roseirufa]|uniref:hypothetical protein n=1 Tax=Actinomadura roseirufa TaxID=2094049 RepID=UPI00104109EF|nr:hypothetical protein [Actinomadura roseirufa]